MNWKEELLADHGPWDNQMRCQIDMAYCKNQIDGLTRLGIDTEIHADLIEVYAQRIVNAVEAWKSLRELK